MARFRENGETEHKLKCVNQWMHILPPANIAAFDFALLTALSRAGARRRWLKESEANGYCLEAAKMAQTNYAGWSDFFCRVYRGSLLLFPSTERGLTAACLRPQPVEHFRDNSLH
ncbi:hypothetical protein HMSSN036_16560 [Paenibacillus macerans]|nr:hypothetical protein HMSSN036_16560 [Paenibacillus macerans]